MKTNQFASTCTVCRGTVAPREGRLVGERPVAGRWIVRHLDCHAQVTTGLRPIAAVQHAGRTVIRPTVMAPAPPVSGRFHVWALGRNGAWYRRTTQAYPYSVCQGIQQDIERQWREVVILREGMQPPPEIVPTRTVINCRELAYS